MPSPLGLCDAGIASLGSLASTSRAVSPARPGILAVVCVTCQRLVSASRVHFGACANSDCEKLWRPPSGNRRSIKHYLSLRAHSPPSWRSEEKRKRKEGIQVEGSGGGERGGVGDRVWDIIFLFFFRPVYLLTAVVCYSLVIACSEAVSPGKLLQVYHYLPSGPPDNTLSGVSPSSPPTFDPCLL